MLRNRLELIMENVTIFFSLSLSFSIFFLFGHVRTITGDFFGTFPEEEETFLAAKTECMLGRSIVAANQCARLTWLAWLACQSDHHNHGSTKIQSKHTGAQA